MIDLKPDEGAPVDTPTSPGITDSGTTEPTDTTRSETEPTETATPPENYAWVDDDGDGYTERQGDCDDEHSSVNPGEEEDCETRADDNCGGWVNDECRIPAWPQYRTSLVWTATDGVVYADTVFEVVTFGGGEPICAFGGQILGEEAKAKVPCPACEWTFKMQDELVDVWTQDSCAAFVLWWDDVVGTSMGDLFGFTFLPLDRSAYTPSAAGWLVGYDYYRHRWFEVLPGSIFAYWGYGLSADADGGSAWWTYSAYWGSWYYWYPYGSAVRDYNP